MISSLSATGNEPAAGTSMGNCRVNSPAALHPALLALARVLARQAAAELFRASSTNDDNSQEAARG